MEGQTLEEIGLGTRVGEPVVQRGSEAEHSIPGIRPRSPEFGARSP